MSVSEYYVQSSTPVVKHTLHFLRSRYVISSYTPVVAHTYNISVSKPLAKAIMARVYRVYNYATLVDTRSVSDGVDSCYFPDIVTPASYSSLTYYRIRRETNRALILADGREVYHGFTSETLEITSGPYRKLSYSNLISTLYDTRSFNVELLSLEPQENISTPTPVITSTVKTHPAIVVHILKPCINYMSLTSGFYITGSLVLVNTSPYSGIVPLISIQYACKPSDVACKIEVSFPNTLQPGSYSIQLKIPLDKYRELYGEPLVQLASLGQEGLRQLQPASLVLSPDGDYVTATVSFIVFEGETSVTLWLFIPSKIMVEGNPSTILDGGLDITGFDGVFTYHVTGWYRVGDDMVFEFPTECDIKLPETISQYSSCSANYRLRFGSSPIIGCNILRVYMQTSVVEYPLDFGSGLEASIDSVDWGSPVSKLKLRLSNKYTFPIRDLNVRVTSYYYNMKVYERQIKIPLIPVGETIVTIRVPTPSTSGRRIVATSPLFTVEVSE